MTTVFRRIRHAAALFAIGIAIAFSAPQAQANAKYASIVIDAHTGQVLRQRNADKRLYPASLTKMMTLYMAFDAIDRGLFTLDSNLPVSRTAAAEPASKLGLRRGSSITMRDAIQACATKSANDAATVLAEALGGSKKNFALMMTAKAQQLGMRNTRFKNPHGLTASGQLSTARDMSILGRRLFSDFPEYYAMFERKRFKYGGRSYRATNKLLGKYPGADGIKTGYTRASGFNLVASAEQDGNRIIGVVFGGKSSASRNSHMRKILDEGFAKLPKRAVRAYAAAGPLSATPIPRIKPSRAKGVPTGGAPMLVASAQPTATTVPSVKGKPRALIAMRAQSDPWAVAKGLRALQRIIVPEAEAAEATGEWAVQIGAYRKLDQAEKILEQAKALRSPQLLRASPVVTRRVSNGRPIYRARFQGLAKGQAENACQSLTRRGIACFALKSSG